MFAAWLFYLSKFTWQMPLFSCCHCQKIHVLWRLTIINPSAKLYTKFPTGVKEYSIFVCTHLFFFSCFFFFPSFSKVDLFLASWLATIDFSGKWELHEIGLDDWMDDVFIHFFLFFKFLFLWIVSACSWKMWF